MGGFRSNGKTIARDAALVIPGREIAHISNWRPALGMARVDLLNTGDFVRIWVNRGGMHDLIHLPVQGASTDQS